MSGEQKEAERKAEEAKPNSEEEVITLSGLVVDWDIPSRSALMDWFRRGVEDVRVKEVVELFPEEVCARLETARRWFYSEVEKLTIQAYSLHILPLSRLAEFQDTVERMRRRLREVDAMMKQALDDAYTKRAVEYFLREGQRKPRIVESVSERFRVTLMPLRIDRQAWLEQLDGQLKEELRRLEEYYAKRMEELEDEYRRRREMSEEQFRRYVEGLREEWERRREELSRAASWARGVAGETARRVRFDAVRLLVAEVREAVAAALEAFKAEDAKERDRELRRLAKSLRSLVDSASSIGAHGTAQLAEKVLAAVEAGDRAALEDVAGRLAGGQP